MRKITLISYYFAPLGRADGVNRSYLVKYLYDLNWQVNVICCANPQAVFRNFQTDNTLLEVLPKQVNIQRIPAPFWAPLTGLSALAGLAPDPFAAWIEPAVQRAAQSHESPGMVLAIVPPVTNAKVAYRLALQTNAPLVLDFRDNVFNIPRTIVAHSRAIIASTPLSLKEMQAHYGVADKVGFVIYNGSPVAYPQAAPAARKKAKGLRIVYAGLLNLNQDPAVLARAIKRMESRYPACRDQVEVDYYGPRNFYTSLFLRPYLQANIRYRGYLPFLSLLDQLAQADLGYTSLRPRGNAYRIPSKVFQYIATHTPILAAGPDGDLASLINSKQIGRFSHYHDLDAQADDIHDLLCHPESVQKMRQNLADLQAQFSMAAQVKKLSRHLEQVVA